MIAFNHDLDVSTIDSRAVRVEKLPPGAAQSPAEFIPARTSVASTNQKVLMVWPSRLLTPGHYRVVMNSVAPLTFVDIEGQAIAAGTPSELGDTVLTTFDVEDQP
jgi:hypothetical protein